VSYIGPSWLTDAVNRSNQSDEISCLNKANASSQVMAIDNIVTNLAKNWHPTGYYRPAEVQTLLDMFATEAEQAGIALRDAPLSTSDARELKAQAFKDVVRRYLDQSQAYRQALKTAKTAGSNAIDAPGLKNWVIGSMRSISDAYLTATVLHCRQSWLEKWLDRAYRGMAAIGGVAFRILGVAANLAINVVEAAEKAIGIAGVIIKYAPYVGAGLGAYLLYNFVKKKTTQ
jgi:ribosomal protein L17